MAGQIAKVGFDLAVHDLRRVAAAAPRLNEGAAWADSPKEARSDVSYAPACRAPRRWSRA